MKKASFLVLLCAISIGCERVDRMSQHVESEQNKVHDIFKKKPDFIEITEFFDFGSEDSLEAMQTIQALENEFDNKVRIKRKHFPMYSKMRPVHEAAECARDQGKFYEFYHEYFKNYFGNKDEETLQEIALRIEIDKEEFSTCYRSGVMKSRISMDKSYGKRYDIKEAPFFLINDEIEGST